MKTLKLTAFEADALSKKEMSKVLGGYTVCGCGCQYAEQGGSSTADNGSANNSGAFVSPDVPLEDMTWVVQ